MMVAKVLAEGKRLRLGYGVSRGRYREVVSLSADRQVKEAGVQSYEPTCLRANAQAGNITKPKVLEIG